MRLVEATWKEQIALANKARHIQDNALTAFYGSAITTGAMGFIPLQGIMGRSGQGMPALLDEFMARRLGGVENWSNLRARIEAAARGGLEEGLTESLETLINNQLALTLYDDEREALDGLGDSFLAGIILGAGPTPS